MRKTLLATTALVVGGMLAVGPAMAADKMSVGVGGYMEQWVGMNNLDGDNQGGIAQWSDSEIFFKGKLEADNGLTFSVKVELEGNTPGRGGETMGDVIDESQMTISGSFGQIVLGSEDHPAALMHYGNQDVGVAYCSDGPGWVGVTGCSRNNKLGLGTNGWIVGGDEQKIAYYTPRMNGIQLGAAYIPNHEKEDANGAPLNNDNAGWSIGVNAKQNVGDASVAISFGHYQHSQEGGPLATEAEMEAIEDYADALDTDALAKGKGVSSVSGAPSKILYDLASIADDANDAIKARGKKADDFTFTNFGLQVGFGSFGLNVAYATVDGGAYTANAAGDIVKDTSNDYELTSAGVKYSDGPMAVSLTHMEGEADNGSEASTTMLSMAYTLAPGIASKSSIISGEDGKNEGMAFVTGVTIGF